MSADEDNELRDLIVQTLEDKGVINNIKAELRASVFLALESEGSFRDKIPIINRRLEEFLKNPEGKRTVSLVREFLEFFNLKFTLAVFDPEVNYGTSFLSREDLCRECKLDSEKSDLPLIASLLNEGKPAESSHISIRSDSGFIQTMPKESLPTDDKLDSINSGLTSNHLTEGLQDLNTNDSSYEGFFDEPLPTEPALGLFNVYSSNAQANQKEPKNESENHLSNQNNNDQNPFPSFVSKIKDSKTKEKNDDNVLSTESKMGDINLLFAPKTDSLTIFKDFPPLNSRSNIDSDWLFNTTSQKKTLPSLKLDLERKASNSIDDEISVTSEHSSKSSVKPADESKPKSDISDSNELSEQSIEEEIEEELSGVDELLSSISVGEDSTSDQTVSSVAGYDYVEKCNFKK